MKNKIIHEVLKNGLNVYLVPDKKKHSVFIDLMVKYGAFHSDFVREGKEIHVEDGMAHLIEHLLFEKNQYGNFRNLFGKKEMQTNAITSTYMTDFYVDVVEDFDFALEHLIKGISIPVFTENDIENIKPPIYQEIKMRNDEIFRTTYKSQNRNLFHKYSYVDGLGSEKMVKNFSYDLVKFCYDTFYQPKNEILFIVGNFESNEVLTKIHNIYKELEFKNIDFHFLKKDEPKEVKKIFETFTMPIAKDYISISYKIDFIKIPKRDRRMFSYYLKLFGILNFSNISPLYKELIKENICETNMIFDFLGDYLVLNVENYVNDEEKFINKIKETLKHPFFDEEIVLLQLKKEKMVKLCADSTLYNLSRSFKTNCSYYDTYRFDEIEELNGLNFDDFKKFVEILDFQNFTITKIINKSAL